jgi:DHA1 family tetracycline resistance protein-like MFS transporter
MRNRALLFIFVTILVDVIGIGIIIPVIPELIQKLTGGGLSEASEYGGWLMFSFAIMQFFFAPLMGELSDRFGRKPILLISLFGLGLDYIFHAFAPTIFWLFVGRVLAGICGASFTVANAYIADISTPEDKAKNFGMVGAAFGLGFIVGPVIGGLAAEYSVQLPFFIAAGLSLANMLYGLFVIPESLPISKRRNFSFKKANPVASILGMRRYPMIFGMIASFLFIHLASHAVQSTWAYFTMLKFSWNTSDVGYSLAFVGVVVAIVQAGLVGKIKNRLGERNTIITGFLLYGTGMILFAFAPTGWALYLFSIPYCLGGIAGPTIQGLLSNQVPDNEQGELQGMLTSVMSLTAIIGPPMMTGMFATFTEDPDVLYFPGAPFILGAVLMITSLMLMIKALNRIRAASL